MQWARLKLFSMCLSCLALTISSQGPSYAQQTVRDAESLNDRAEKLIDAGKYSEAIKLSERALAITEKAQYRDDSDVARALANFAWAHHARGTYSQAEPLYKRALSLMEKERGSDNSSFANYLTALADVYVAQGRYRDAEPLYKRALAIQETLSDDALRQINNLADLYAALGSKNEARPLYERALISAQRNLTLKEQSYGPQSENIASALNDVAVLYAKLSRDAEAVPFYKRALLIAEKAHGSNSPDVADYLQNLADAYADLHRYTDAEPLFKRALTIREKALGRDNDQVAKTLNSLGWLYLDMARYGESESQFKRALAIDEKIFGPDHPMVSMYVANLAQAHFMQKNWSSAADHLRRSTAILERRAGRSIVGSVLTGKRGSEALLKQWQFQILMKAAYRRPAGSTDPKNVSDMFLKAQWAVASEAAQALVQMAARAATGKSKLTILVRERQDLVSEWQSRDAERVAAVLRPMEMREKEREVANSSQLNAVETRIRQIDQRLIVEFPDYAALVTPAALSVEDVQAQLGADEALVLFLDTPEWEALPEESFIWVVTKNAVRWVRSEFGTSALAREVAALRCGLDATAWDGDGAARCTGLLSLPLDKKLKPGDPLPFDPARAHRLYTGLFGEVDELIKGKHLLIVPSGPLTQLPFQVMVSSPPSAIDHKLVDWLTRSHAITVLPAVSSLKALRRVGKPSAATKTMIGFGNPLLDGDQAHQQIGGSHKQQAALARDHNGCAQATAQRTATLRSSPRNVSQIAWQGDRVDLAELRRQAPLPETADELCAVARSLKADFADIHLGARAIEREVKALSASGRLAQYRVLHFATHGTLAGQLRGTSQPGLILTPPSEATEEDDGYLTASEIAALKLDADWVILSACNTAGGIVTGEGAEALSGLARAFFYAQARALLVSHWEVDSDATVKLITGAVGETARDAKVGRAEALRRAMLSLIDEGQTHEAHPAYWAPFVVVGEGAAGR